MLPRFQVQIQITVPATLSLATSRIRDSRLTYAAQARNNRPSLGLPLKVVLDRPQHCVGAIAGKPVKLPRERLRLNELHIVILPQCDSQRQCRVARTPSYTEGAPSSVFEGGAWVKTLSFENEKSRVTSAIFQQFSGLRRFRFFVAIFIDNGLLL